jgi:hypothetical protein
LARISSLELLAKPACLGIYQADWVGGGPPLCAPGT